MLFLKFVVQDQFAEQTYYKEAMVLIKGYKPMMDKLGEPVFAKSLDMSDPFQYHDGKTAKVFHSSSLLVFQRNRFLKTLNLKKGENPNGWAENERRCHDVCHS